MDKNTDTLSALLAAAIVASERKKAQEQIKENANGVRDEMRELAALLYDCYIMFQDAGFTAEQAFQLTLALRD